MNREDFGRLVASLRHEHDDEDGLLWNQERLAEEANQWTGAPTFSRDIIASIERGKRRLDQETLLALAAALQLTSGERKEFFMAASGIDSEEVVRPENDPEEVLNQLMGRMKRIYLPAHILDPYYDIVAVNSGVIELLDWESTENVMGATGEQLFRNNGLLFAFSDEGVDHFKARMGESWAHQAFETMMFFRTISLRYRSNEYFQSLLRELRKLHYFRRFWRAVYLEEKDQFLGERFFLYNSPKWGPLQSFGATITALTAAGELYLCVQIPANRETAGVFSQIMLESGEPSVFRLADWPKKDTAIGIYDIAPASQNGRTN